MTPAERAKHIEEAARAQVAACNRRGCPTCDALRAALVLPVEEAATPGCDGRGVIINALAYLLHATYNVEGMSDEQRSIWRGLVGRARDEYDRLHVAASPKPALPPSPPATPETRPLGGYFPKCDLISTPSSGTTPSTELVNGRPVYTPASESATYRDDGQGFRRGAESKESGHE